MYDYRQLLNNIASVWVESIVCCSSEIILVFRVHMDLYLQLLSCGCCVDIQQCGMYNILSYAVHLDQTYITLLP